jgi:hypothetical protein
MQKKISDSARFFLLLLTDFRRFIRGFTIKRQYFFSLNHIVPSFKLSVDINNGVSQQDVDLRRLVTWAGFMLLQNLHSLLPCRSRDIKPTCYFYQKAKIPVGLEFGMYFRPPRMVEVLAMQEQLAVLWFVYLLIQRNELALRRNYFFVSLKIYVKL